MTVSGDKEANWATIQREGGEKIVDGARDGEVVEHREFLPALPLVVCVSKNKVLSSEGCYAAGEGSCPCHCYSRLCANRGQRLRSFPPPPPSVTWRWEVGWFVPPGLPVTGRDSKVLVDDKVDNLGRRLEGSGQITNLHRPVKSKLKRETFKGGYDSPRSHLPPAR